MQIDTAPHIVMGNGLAADCYIQADAVTALAELNRALDERSVKVRGFHTAQVRDRLAVAAGGPVGIRERAGPPRPARGDPGHRRRLPGEFDLVLGSGHQTDFGTMIFQRSREVLSNYGMFGAIGQAPLLTIGMIVANGGRPAFVVEGDASFLMHLPEFETACRYGFPILVVVMNDEALGAEYHKSAVQGADPELAVIPTPDLGRSRWRSAAGARSRGRLRSWPRRCAITSATPLPPSSTCASAERR